MLNKRETGVAFFVTGENAEREFRLLGCWSGEKFAVSRENVHNFIVTHENPIQRICTFRRTFFAVNREKVYAYYYSFILLIILVFLYTLLPLTPLVYPPMLDRHEYNQ